MASCLFSENQAFLLVHQHTTA